MSEVLIPYVNALVVLDGDGERLLAKYYDGRAKPEQVKLEQFLHKKTKSVTARSDTEVLLNDHEVVVFRAGQECKFFLSSSNDENELILTGVLDAIFDTVSQLLRSQVDKRTMLDNLGKFFCDSTTALILILTNCPLTPPKSSISFRTNSLDD